MGTLDLARWQFAATTSIHWMFVILTMGLVPLVAIMHTRAAFTRDEGERTTLERMTRFWGQLYLINYALGIVTGLVMEFQFGLGWSGLSKFAGNVFGAPLALETLVAFFAESTFLGMWIFGWGRLRRGVHVTLIWLVALTAYTSAYWILVANGFMQHPVGYEIRGGVAYLTDFAALLTNSNALFALAHITAAALLTGGLFVAGISAYHRARGTDERDVFGRSLRLGVVTAAIAAFPTYVVGGMQYPMLGETQPMKLAALEPGDGTAALAARMAAQHGPGDYVPPHWIVHAQYAMLDAGYLAFIVAAVAILLLYRRKLMRFVPVGLLAAAAVGYPVGEFAGGLVYGTPGPNRLVFYLASVVVLAVLLLFGDRVVRVRRLGYAMVAVIPLPFLAALAGWLFREGGRQPWVVYGQLTAAEAVGPTGLGTAVLSFTAFTGVFAALAVTNWILIARYAHRGPAGTQLGTEELAVAPLREEPRPTF